MVCEGPFCSQEKTMPGHPPSFALVHLTEFLLAAGSDVPFIGLFPPTTL